MTNDPKDRHVVAAAVRAGAKVIVTANLRDFPEDALEPLGLTAKSPDTFLMDLLGFDERDMLDAVMHIAAQKTRPPMTPLAMLQRIGKTSPNIAAAALTLLENAEE